MLLFAPGVRAPRLQAQAPATQADVIARFHINEAGYFADVAKYLEALEQLDTAFNYSAAPAIKSEALSSKASILAGFLDDPQGAIQQYNTIIQNFQGTPAYQPALYQSAMLRYSNNDAAGARTFFQRYIREFPNGPDAATSEFMIGQTAPAPKPVVPLTVQALTGRTIRISLDVADTITITGAQGLSVGGQSAGTRASFTAARLNGAQMKVESPGPIGLGGKTYRGKFLLIPDGSNVRAVNEVSVEDYLYSVVPSESVSSWPMEALKTQAVASRTYAYYAVSHPRSPGKFDLYDDTRAQVYAGYGHEGARAHEAVDTTRNQVLTYQGQVILAYFTSNNGGSTADPEYVFGKAYPYLKATKDSVSPLQPNGKWTRQFPVSDVESALRKAGYPVSGIQKIIPGKTCPSGRVVELTIEYRGGRITLNTRTQFRTAINNYIEPKKNPENMPEILISISIGGGHIDMAGGGWGHGVGMSQYGAKGMADGGANYANILSKYYIGTELKTLS